MSTIRVVATSLGIYNDTRQRPGTEFDLELETCKKDKDGKPMLPSWVVPASAAAHAAVEERRKADERKFMEGAIYASGNKGRLRTDTWLDAMHAGRGPQSGDAKIAEAASGNEASGGATKKKIDELDQALHGKKR